MDMPVGEMGPSSMFQLDDIRELSTIVLHTAVCTVIQGSTVLPWVYSGVSSNPFSHIKTSIWKHLHNSMFNQNFPQNTMKYIKFPEESTDALGRAI